MRPTCRIFPTLLAVLAFRGWAGAWAEPVDLELVLAADASESMDGDIARSQRLAYAEALESPEIMAAITMGNLGAVAVTYVEWGDVGLARTALPWTRIDSASTARDLAARLREIPVSHFTKTSISHAIDFSSGLFAGNGFEGARRVIDVSGNGPNNQGERVDLARDRAVAAGHTINGLPILTDTNMPRGLFDTGFDLRLLDRYFSTCVTGGPGAFTLPVRNREDLARALKSKLFIEISGGASRSAERLVPAADRSQPEIPC